LTSKSTSKRASRRAWSPKQSFEYVNGQH